MLFLYNVNEDVVMHHKIYYIIQNIF